MDKLVGTMWMGMGAGDHTNEKETHAINIHASDLPANRQSVQPAIAFAGGGDTSNLSPGSIPQGFKITCQGSDGNGWGWAIVTPYDGSPIFSAVDFDDQYKPTMFQFKLGMYLHCDNPAAGGGNVQVQVYAVQ